MRNFIAAVHIPIVLAWLLTAKHGRETFSMERTCLKFRGILDDCSEVRFLNRYEATGIPMSSWSAG